MQRVAELVNALGWLGLVGIITVNTNGVFASDKLACADLQCDCNVLFAKSLQAPCLKREAELKAVCTSRGLGSTDFCAFFGPEASRGTHLWLDATVAKPSNEASVLQLKWESTRSALMQSLKRFDDAKNSLAAKAVREDLGHLLGRVDDLLSVEDALVEQLMRDRQEQAAHQSWALFAELVLATAQSLHEAREDLVLRKQSAWIAEEIRIVEAQLYEQSGFGYGKAGNPESAARMWKRAAEIAGELMQVAEKRGDQHQADRYRYQRSTRLHRAREYWSRMAKP